MEFKKTFKTAVCFALIICMTLCLSACNNKLEIRNYSDSDRIQANANAKIVHTAVSQALAKMYGNGERLDEHVLSISNFNPVTLEPTGKKGKGSLDKIYDDEGNIINLDLTPMLGENFMGYFIAGVYDTDYGTIDYVEWIDPNTFALLSQNNGSYGLPEGVTEDNLLIGSYPSQY